MPLRDDERQALAVHLGDIAAGDRDPLLDGAELDYMVNVYDCLESGNPRIEEWAWELRRFGPEVCALAALACARVLAPLWLREHPDDLRLERALAAIEETLRTGHPPSLQISVGIVETDRVATETHEFRASRVVRAAFEAVRSPHSSMFHVRSAALHLFEALDAASSPVPRPHAILADLWQQLQLDPAFAQVMALGPRTRLYATVRLVMRRGLLPLLAPP